ncbi:MAG: hypothetical protein D6707_07290 [Bacteroidetes bacterium]|nr:MAG: hypothetical protein D6707_07290 [Bacteroidota bacterium]
MKKITLTISALAFMAVGFNSCKKAKMNRETTTSEDISKAEEVMDDVFNVTNEAGDSKDLNESSTTNKWTPLAYSFANDTGCVTITLSPAEKQLPLDTFPKTLTVDFGTSGCVGKDGKTRKGKIKATYTGRFKIAGNSITITTENYSVDDYLVDATKTVTNQGKNSAGHTYHTITEQATITTPDGKTITWSSNRQREWIEGEDTWLWKLNSDSTWTWVGLSGIFDDVWEITGNGEGTNRDGIDFTVNITTPLHIRWCNYVPEITQGVIEAQPDGLKKRTIDYGNDQCDNEAVVTIGKKQKTIQLK